MRPQANAGLHFNHVALLYMHTTLNTPPVRLSIENASSHPPPGINPAPSANISSDQPSKPATNRPHRMQASPSEPKDRQRNPRLMSMIIMMHIAGRCGPCGLLRAASRGSPFPGPCNGGIRWRGCGADLYIRAGLHVLGRTLEERLVVSRRLNF